MVSVVTCTIRDSLIGNVFNNYISQKYEMKELIIILNKNSMNLDKWIEKSKSYKDVSVYQIEEDETLGGCLNFAIEKSKYPYIAKFDDDDFYGANYLNEAMETFYKIQDVDIWGKNSYYVYLENIKKLVYMDNIQNDYVDKVAGATLVFKKAVWDKVKFLKENTGEDYFFIKNSLELGYKLYCGSGCNFAVIRKEGKEHTWKVTNEYFLNEGRLIDYSGDFRNIVVR